MNTKALSVDALEARGEEQKVIVCCECREEMLCNKNAVGALFGASHVYPGDRFKCPKCGVVILKTNDIPIFDPNHVILDEYLDMDARGEAEP